MEKEKEDYGDDREKKGKIEIAKSMLSDNLDIDIISKHTGLSKEVINKIENT